MKLLVLALVAIVAEEPLHWSIPLAREDHVKVVTEHLFASDSL
jgi:hypothetical protein